MLTFANKYDNITKPVSYTHLLTKQDLGRDRFLERAWDWKKQYGGRIVEPVSYTHLDVYKRQLAPISDTTIASASTQQFRDGRPADVGGCVKTRFKSVSYTHLKSSRGCLPAA